MGKQGVEWPKTLELFQYDRAILDVNVRLPQSLDTEIERVSTMIAKLAVDHANETQQDQVKLLLGLKGIDHYTAMILLLETRDIKRFHHQTNWSHGQDPLPQHTNPEKTGTTDT